jgi:hypothetical protein
MHKVHYPLFASCRLGALGFALAFTLGCPGPDAAPEPMKPATASPAATIALDRPRADDDVPAVRPGKGIGPIDLGMSQKEVEMLGLPIAPHPGSGLSVGPYRVLLEGGKVVLVEVGLADLPTGLRVGARVFAPAERDIAVIAAELAGCGPLEAREGGNIIPCSGEVLVAAAGPPGIVEIKVMSPHLAR